jgi:hypothetical protein
MSKIADKDSRCIHAAHMKLYSFTLLFVEEFWSLKSREKKRELYALNFFDNRSE